MKHIGLLSDTHGFLPEQHKEFLKDCDEIWHVGDVGSPDVIESLEKICLVKAVYGNIDGTDIRGRFPEVQVMMVEQLKVVMMHIGGYPGRYQKSALELIQSHQPGLFISGHSHILKVIYDKKHNLLHLNPGAAGKFGIHQKITMMRFVVDNAEIKNLEIFEADKSPRLI